MILIHQPPESWDWRHVLPCLVFKKIFPQSAVLGYHMMVSLPCRLDWIENHLGDILLGVLVRVFPERINRIREEAPCRLHHPMGWSPK